MHVNRPITDAISKFQSIGEDFHECFLWHVVHGFVVASPDCLFLGYYYTGSDWQRPRPRGEANAAFVSYHGGSLRGISPLITRDLRVLAFKRAFKGDDTVRFHDAQRMRRLISKLNT
jgi:hypothetical protein